LELSIVAAEVAAKLSLAPLEELLWIEENVAIWSKIPSSPLGAVRRPHCCFFSSH